MLHIFMIPAVAFHGIYVVPQGAGLHSSFGSLVSMNATVYTDGSENKVRDYWIYAVNIKADRIALN
jgi:hypothetical protein